MEVGLLRLEGGGEERVGGGERVVAEAEEVEEGLAVGEGNGRDAAEARGLDEVGVLEVVVLRQEDGGGERVGAAGLLGCEGGGGGGREGVVGAEVDLVAGEDDLVQLVAGGVVAEHGEGIHRRRRRCVPPGFGFCRCAYGWNRSASVELSNLVGLGCMLDKNIYQAHL